MATFKIRATVAVDGSLIVAGLPFKSGEQVEITIKSLAVNQEERDRYPLRGKPYKYDLPFEGIALHEWGIQE